MRSLLLKVGATLLTLAATTASALSVTGHLKNPAAPLQPIVLSSSQLSGVTVTPGVKPTNTPPITSTYAS